MNSTSTSLELTVRAQTKVAELRDRMVERMTDEHGQTAAEYLGVIVVIAVIIGVLVKSDIGDTIVKAINGAIGKVGAGKGNV